MSDVGGSPESRTRPSRASSTAAACQPETRERVLGHGELGYRPELGGAGAGHRPLPDARRGQLRHDALRPGVDAVRHRARRARGRLLHHGRQPQGARSRVGGRGGRAAAGPGRRRDPGHRAEEESRPTRCSTRPRRPAGGRRGRAGPAVPVVAVDQARARVGHRAICSTSATATVRHIAGPLELARVPAAGRRLARDAGGRRRRGRPSRCIGDWSARAGYDLGRRLAARPPTSPPSSSPTTRWRSGCCGPCTRPAGGSREISVVGFDDIPEAAYFTPPLTTIRPDFDEMGTAQPAAAAADDGRRGRTAIVRSSSRARRVAVSSKSWRIVVSGGEKYGASGCRGKSDHPDPTWVSRPASFIRRSTPSAIWSLAAKIAVTGVSRVSTQVVAGLCAPVAVQRLWSPGAGGLERRAPAVEPGIASSQPRGPATSTPCGDRVRADARSRSWPRPRGRRRPPGPRGRVRPRPPPAVPRRARRQLLGGVLLGCDRQVPVDAVQPQTLDGLADRAVIERLEAGDDDEVAGLVRGALDPAQRGRRAVQSRVERDHAERVGATGDQCPRHRVGPVVELGHRVEHALARLRADMAAAVDHPRDVWCDTPPTADVRHHRGAAGDRFVVLVYCTHLVTGPSRLSPSRRAARMLALTRRV